MNIHAGTGSRTRGRSCCRRPATRCPRRARRATSGRPGWCRTPAATPRPARWPCWRCCAARSSRTDGIIIDAASGTTGAGRKASEDFSFSEVDGDFRAYRVLRHQHTPEIERALALAGQPPLKVTFTPHLLPTRRGILATVYGRLNSGKTAADAAAAIDRFVAGKPFLRAAKPDAVRLHPVVGTNRVLLGADADPERGVAMAFAAHRQPGQGGRRTGGPERQSDARSRRDDRLAEPAWERAMTTAAKSFTVPHRVPLRRRRRRRQAGGGRAQGRGAHRLGRALRGGRTVHRQPDARRAVRFRGRAAARQGHPRHRRQQRQRERDRRARAAPSTSAPWRRRSRKAWASTRTRC